MSSPASRKNSTPGKNLQPGGPRSARAALHGSGFAAILSHKLAVAMLSLFFAASASCESGGIIKGRVVGVHDGDSITLLSTAEVQVKIRLEGIDAPELKQPFGTRSKTELSTLVFGKEVQITVTGKDRYKRTLGRVQNAWHLSSQCWMLNR